MLGESGEEIAVADNHCRTDEQKQSEAKKTHGWGPGAAPFPQSESPESAENDDAGHVEGPTGESIFAHLGFAHGVEEKLKVPGGAGEGREQVIGEHRNGRAEFLLGNRDVLDEFTAGGVDGGLDDGFVSDEGVAVRIGGEVLVSSFVTKIQSETPDEVGGEAPD